MVEEKEILIQAEPRLIVLFFPILEKGVEIEVSTGGTLRELLISQLGIDEAYADREIQTIFLNARAIDDLDQTAINHGDVLALSGAMPGLVGATLRKGGKYAAMRREISGTEMTASAEQRPGCIRLKLFNSVLNDLALNILARGIRVSTVDLTGVFKMIRPELSKENLSILVNGTFFTPQAVVHAMENQDQCRLRVIDRDHCCD